MYRRPIQSHKTVVRQLWFSTDLVTNCCSVLCRLCDVCKITVLVVFNKKYRKIKIEEGKTSAVSTSAKGIFVQESMRDYKALYDKR